MNTRIGFGYDSHAFKPGVPLRIGGLALDHPEGLAGHSDGDVLLHALTDALLGAVAAGDIGSFFPPGDPRWKNADSAIFLNLALEELQNAGYQLVNVDITLILAAPKIGPIAGEMRARVADLLDASIDQVSIKAKTPEGLNLDHVAQCHAVALVERVQEPDELKSMSAVIETQRQLEDVVEDLLSSVHGVPKKRVIPAVYDTDDMTYNASGPRPKRPILSRLSSERVGRFGLRPLEFWIFFSLLHNFPLPIFSTHITLSAHLISISGAQPNAQSRPSSSRHP